MDISFTEFHLAGNRSEITVNRKAPLSPHKKKSYEIPSLHNSCRPEQPVPVNSEVWNFDTSERLHERGNGSN